MYNLLYSVKSDLVQFIVPCERGQQLVHRLRPFKTRRRYRSRSPRHASTRLELALYFIKSTVPCDHPAWPAIATQLKQANHPSQLTTYWSIRHRAVILSSPKGIQCCRHNRVLCPPQPFLLPRPQATPRRRRPYTICREKQWLPRNMLSRIWSRHRRQQQQLCSPRQHCASILPQSTQIPPRSSTSKC